MERTYSKTKNTFFYTDELFREGEKYFAFKQYEKALKCFVQFSQKSISCKKFIAGRTAITLMKLGNFEEAKELLKQSIEDVPEKERDYISLMAECLYGHGRFSDAEDLCEKIYTKYPQIDNADIRELEKKVSIHPHLGILRNASQVDRIYNKAMENIISILINDKKNKNEEEAAYYAECLINSPINDSSLPYVFLRNYYPAYHNDSDAQSMYCKVINLLKKLEKSFVPVNEKNILRQELLSVYEKSPCYQYSDYYQPDSEVEEQPSLMNMAELAEKAKLFARLTKEKYLPILNLDLYFASEG
jgi:tetratricopeptide (TPR) repeat protein